MNYNNLIRFKNSIIILIVLFTINSSQAQRPKSISKGKIYALIIGISEYQDKNIKNLNFAHRDAELFKDYLTSTAGGSVPDDQIKLLTNQQATISNIYVAKQWLENKAKKDDLVIFYFSGHGDVESSLYKLGFLLAYDTPHKNYLNNAVRIEDINIMANTMSVEKKADVILITDACHSGKLAGSDNRGRALVGEQLSIVEKNEIRIASCESEQLSKEDPVWGGGRGVFSFYLLNGLKGLADSDDMDGYVTLQELKLYLEKNVQKDVFKFMNEDQVPVVKGRGFTPMAIVDKPTLEELKDSTLTFGDSGNTLSKSVSQKASVIDRYFDHLSKMDLANVFDFNTLNDKNTDDILNEVLSKEALIPNDSIDYTEWISSINNDFELKAEFQQKLGSAIHNHVQQAINDYLIVDAEELEKRQYYNARTHTFHKYEAMLGTAMSLIDTSNYLHHMIRVKQHYFKGVDARLNIIYSANPDSLLELALTQQNMALKLEDRAAYIHNELGILNKMKQNASDTSFHFFREAEKHFTKAIELVPTWALPYSNLSSLYFRWNKYHKGLELGEKAIELKPDYLSGYINYGRNSFMLKNYMKAEENYLHATNLNSKHYLPFELLGDLYIETAEYKKADASYYESRSRLIGQGFNSLEELPGDSDNDGFKNDLDQEIITIMECVIDESKVGKRDFMVPFYKGCLALAQNNIEQAVAYFKRVIEINPEDPITYKYLGDLAYKRHDWMQAEIYYMLAQQYYLPNLTFNEYVENSIKSHKYKGCKIAETYKMAHFTYTMIQYILGDIYTEWGYFSKAENIYNELLAVDNENMIHYYLLWNLYEIQGQYERTEKVIISSQVINKNWSENELYAFYERQISRNVDLPLNQYKAGLVLFNRLKNDNNKFSVFEGFVEKDDDVLNMFDDLIIPGTNKKYLEAKNPTNEIQKSITYLESSKASIKNQMILTDIYQRLGDLYALIGNSLDSKINYKKASEQSDKDASTKEKYIELSIIENQFSDAYTFLQRMENSQQLNYNNLVYYTKFNIHANRLKKADSLLNLARNAYPFATKKIKYLEAKNHFFSKRFDEAISSFESYSSSFDDNDGRGYYSIARIYALKNDKKSALTYLQKAVESGFNYAYVMDKDKAFDFVRDERKWIKSRNNFTPINNILRDENGKF